MRIFLGAAVLVCAAIFTTSCAGNAAPSKAPAAYDAAFWDTWGDGFAEVSTYDFAIPRYGETRDGESILIFASETFSERLRVKSEPGRNPKTDEFPVMKLNWQRNFQTGIYDYSEMVSAFLGLAPVNGRPAGSLAKLSFSRQEWNGHTFMQALFDAPQIRVSGASYFDGDLAQTLKYPAEGVTEEGLAFWARQMAGPYLKPGEVKSVPFLTSLRSARDAHQPLAWSRINLSRGAAAQTIEVPAGDFEVEAFSAQLPNGNSFLFFVEKEAPHRIVRWQFTSGEVAELYSSERVKYWELNGAGGEEALRSLGLEPRAPRFTPED